MKKKFFNKIYGISIDKYKKINKIIKKNDISKFELITNYGLYSGDTNLFKTLTIYDLIKSIKNTKGDIIEFGVWKGNTSILIKKILDIYKIKKKIYLFDHFKGLTHYSKKDTNYPLKWKNQYIGKKSFILKLIKFFKLKRIEIIDKDATKLEKNFFKNKKFCLAIIDVDLYEPTKKILNSIKNNITKNGLIVFDEGNDKNFPGEARAMEEFFQNNRKKYKKTIIPFSRQPDVILQKKK
jgi:hypothetical protein